ncbi:hypothetical protein [Niabella beijingensis]|uniref:hypothetical protein n=1 Tax=Niabella beijingensis TaxID=2872700 RepID=UPI001CBD1793|nr:hypothetical protein [Niabella beijingensis]MBZ4192662.1 hypothetical protein [Niabella beijingensis]
MTRDKKIIRALTFLFILSTSFSLYALLAKKNTAAPVFLFMYDKQRRFLSEDSLSRPEFWDNYPYYILVSMHKSIHLERYASDEKSKSLIEDRLKANKRLFYRFHYVAGQDSVYHQTLQSVTQSGRQVVLLTDRNSVAYLNNFIDTSKHNIDIVDVTDLPIYLEKPGLSYFFRVSKNNTVVDLFVPRKELPEVTDKYISYVFSTSK